MSAKEERNETQQLWHGEHHTERRALITHMQNDSFLQQALFFGSHHKVMCVILVVHNIFQVNT